jgi:hypothetical protein
MPPPKLAKIFVAMAWFTARNATMPTISVMMAAVPTVKSNLGFIVKLSQQDRNATAYTNSSTQLMMYPKMSPTTTKAQSSSSQ